jgi:membrane-associated phospholipid phosphatase
MSHGESDFADSMNHFGEPQVVLPLVAGLYCFVDKYDKESAEMAVNAIVNVTVLSQTTKMLAGRARPTMPDAGDFTGPTTRNGYSSFPSGHTSLAFSVATVMAQRYPKQKWLYYGIAAAVGYSRVQKSAHFPSDVLVGAGMGIYAGNNAVNNTGGMFTIKF